MKQTLLFCALLLFFTNSFAQAPEKMSYQAIIRDTGNSVIASATVGMKISVLKGSASGTVVYTETQTPSTNINGLVSIEFGGGSGFSDIDWSIDSYFIKTETDPAGGSSYTITGTSQLLSVPYALHAKIADNISESVATFRWTSFSTYNQGNGWYAGNNASLFGGISPSNWSDGNGTAYQMSSDKQVLLTLFNKKAYAGNNAIVYSNEWYSYSSTNGQFAGALFRIKNTTDSDIVWNAYWYCTAYGGWGERASVTINGIDTWNSGSASQYASHHESTAITIPANRTSTIIFISGSSPQSSTRATFLAFNGNCLSLPAGLQYVDDLDTASNGWGF